MLAGSGGAVPVIDLAKDGTTPESLAEAVKGAMTSVGFLFITNHGLESDVEAMFATSQNFFENESESEKERCSYGDGNKGYTKVRQEALDPTRFPEGDLKEGMNIGIIGRGPPPVPTQPLPSLLDAKVTEIAEFQHKCFDFCQRLLEAFAIALSLPSDFFTKQHKDDMDSVSILRMLRYPAVPAGAKVNQNRAGSHSDYGSLTLLFQRSDGGEGLQILPPSEPVDSTNWQDVGVVDGAMLVNIGDAIELWTGGQLKSTLHRVQLPPVIPSTGIPDRYSIAYFNQPMNSASLKSVIPTGEISTIDMERMTRKGVIPGAEVTATEHLHARLKVTYGAPKMVEVKA